MDSLIWDDKEVAELNTAGQLNWILQWLQKKELYKTASVLMDEFSALGDEEFGNKEVEVVPDLVPINKELQTVSVHKQGILAVQFHSCHPWLLSSDTAKNLFVSNIKDGRLLSQERQNNPFLGSIIALDCHPTAPFVLVGTMDDKYGLLKITEDDDEVDVETLATFDSHQKYVVRVKWSPDGSMFATGSHDRSVHLYSFDAGQEKADLKKKLYFKGAVEAICWTRDSSELIVSVRDDNFLIYYNIKSQEQKLINMNAMGDLHVSFTCLDLSLSLDGTMLAATTDNSRTILFKTGTPVQLRTFFGMKNDGLSQPRSAWDKRNILYVTSQNQTIYGFDSSTDKIVTTLEGHKNVVRDISYNPKTDTLVSISYDKTIKFWIREEIKED